MPEKTERLNLQSTFSHSTWDRRYGPGEVDAPEHVAAALRRFHRPLPAESQPTEAPADSTTATPEPSQADPWDGFPGAAAFQAAGFDSPDAVFAHEGDLTEIENVGKKTAEKVQALKEKR